VFDEPGRKYALARSPARPRGLRCDVVVPAKLVKSTQLQPGDTVAFVGKPGRQAGTFIATSIEVLSHAGAGAAS
jgi:hypothetical protein